MNEQPESPPESREEQEHDDDSFLQWMALVVLMACWLAEAYL
jgi:hypothetical protein